MYSEDKTFELLIKYIKLLKKSESIPKHITFFNLRTISFNW